LDFRQTFEGIFPFFLNYVLVLNHPFHVVALKQVLN
jgi:hypothetical protein